jgi:hypothetical protein
MVLFQFPAEPGEVISREYTLHNLKRGESKPKQDQVSTEDQGTIQEEGDSATICRAGQGTIQWNAGVDRNYPADTIEIRQAIRLEHCFSSAFFAVMLPMTRFEVQAPPLSRWQSRQ